MSEEIRPAPTPGAQAMDDLDDVAITSAAVGDMLRHDGSQWENTPGRWEVIVSGSSPPVAVTNETGDDWVYGWYDT